jgi:hypothetical protein
MTIDGDVNGFVRDARIAGCGIASVHFVENNLEFVFEKCVFAGCAIDGVNLYRVVVHFVECIFCECRQTGEEEDEQGKEKKKRKRGTCGRSSRGKGTNPVFEKCVFEDNKFGAFISDGASSVFTACLMKRNGI